MPSLSAIQLYWERIGTRLLETFPQNSASGIGWGEPFCFRCGWLAPVKDCAAYERGSVDDKLTKVWNSAGGWLERCHLQDHAHGGAEDPSNLVPMCVACHWHQPACETQERGVAYVNENVRCPVGVQVMTDVLYMGKRSDDGELNNKRRFWNSVRLADRASYLATVEALRAGHAPTVPGLDDPAYCWPLSPNDHVGMLQKAHT